MKLEFEAGLELVAAGIVPKNCSEVTIHLAAGCVVEVTTKSYIEPDKWSKLLDILVQARESGQIRECHEYVNPETSQRFSSEKPLTL